MDTSLRGTNLAGAEWAYEPGLAPIEGQNYLWVSHRDIDYLASKGVAFVRLVFSWEILQPMLGGAFADGYAASLDDRVRHATGLGLTVMIEPHGGEFTRFARYKGHPVGTPAVPDAAFADLWRRLALRFLNDANVVFGLMNEPNDISTMQWFAAAQAAVDAIRGAGAAHLILVPGNGFSQPSSWLDDWYDAAPAPKVSNAVGWATLRDPLGRMAVSVHTYFDADGGGGADDIAAPDIIAQRLAPVVDWARARGLKVHLSEFGANAATPGAQAAVENAIAWMDANADVVIGWAWWAYGPPEWWGGYRFTLCPSGDYTVDDPKMAWLQPHFGGAPTATMRPAARALPAPPDRSFAATKAVAAGDQPGVPAGSYALKVATRTTSSDADAFCVVLVLENPSAAIDIDWQRMTIDLRGHTLVNAWNASVAGSAGVVTVTPTADSRTVHARGKAAFGLCLRRDAASLVRAASQVVVKTLLW